MINVSNEFKEAIKTRTDFEEFATITLKDGTVFELNKEHFTVGNNRYTDGAGGNSIPIGSAIMKTISIDFENFDEQYKSFIFTDSVIDLYVGMQLSGGMYKVNLGRYTVINPETYGETIIITAVDDMYKADKEYRTDLSFPCTAQQVWNDICGQLGILNASPSFSNGNVTIKGLPENAMTYREMLGCIAGIAGGNARIDNAGRLKVCEWNFDETPQHDFTNFKNLSFDTDDITVTGIRIEYGGSVYQSGQDGYLIKVTNQLIDSYNVERVAQNLANKLIGKTFRKFNGDHIGYPIAEFMDTCRFTDRKGNVYNSFLTDISYSFYGFTTLTNSVDSAVRNSSMYNMRTTEIVQLENKLREEKNQRELAIETLEGLISDGKGLYTTIETADDGGQIFYMHDEKNLEDSEIVWMLTQNTFSISNDGMKTWNIGMMVDGTLITQILNTVGINADWINSGALRIVDQYGHETFYANADTGDVRINPTTLKITSNHSIDISRILVRDIEKFTVAELNSLRLNGMTETLQEWITNEIESQTTETSSPMNVILSNEYQAIGTTYDGNVSQALLQRISTNIQVFVGAADLTNDCTFTILSASGMEGYITGSTYHLSNLTQDRGTVEIQAYSNSLKIKATKQFVVEKIRAGEPGTKGEDGKSFSIKFSVPTADDLDDYVAIDGDGAIAQDTGHLWLYIEGKWTDVGQIKGDKGDPGVDGLTWELDVSNVTIKKDPEGNFSPATVTANAYTVNANGKNPFSCYFMLFVSNDSNDWKYSRGFTQSTSVSFNISTSNDLKNTKYIRVVIASKFVGSLASPTSDAIIYDTQTIQVINENPIETGETILQKLSGGFQGIYQDSDGKYYINANYIKSGAIKAQYIDVDDLTAIKARLGTWVVGEKIIKSESLASIADINDIITESQRLGTISNSDKAKITGSMFSNDGVTCANSEAGFWHIANNALTNASGARNRGSAVFQNFNRFIFNNFFSLIRTHNGNENGTSELRNHVIIGESDRIDTNVHKTNPSYPYTDFTIGKNTETEVYGRATFEKLCLFDQNRISNGITVVAEVATSSDGFGDRYRVRFASSSSRRYKNHVRELPDEYAERLYDIPVVEFIYKDGYLAEDDKKNGEKIPGFYAEDFAKIYPDGCVYNADGLPEDWNHRTIIPSMLKLIQNQHEEIESLKNECADLKETVNRLIERLEGCEGKR